MHVSVMAPVVKASIKEMATVLPAQYPTQVPQSVLTAKRQSVCIMQIIAVRQSMLILRAAMLAQAEIQFVRPSAKNKFINRMRYRCQG